MGNRLGWPAYKCPVECQCPYCMELPTNDADINDVPKFKALARGQNAEPEAETNGETYDAFV
jgi:hypothetical protein